MTVLFLPAAKDRLVEIWEYTSSTWDDEQADGYVDGLIATVQKFAARRDSWSPVKQRRFKGVYSIRYRHHFIFFKVMADSLGVISILHESMDLPNRLKEDIGQQPG